MATSLSLCCNMISLLPESYDVSLNTKSRAQAFQQSNGGVIPKRLVTEAPIACRKATTLETRMSHLEKPS